MKNFIILTQKIKPKVFWMVLIDEGCDEMYKVLEALIEKSGVTKKQMAKDIGMKYVTLLAKLSGDSKFTLDEAVKIREYLKAEVPIEMLFGKD